MDIHVRIPPPPLVSDEGHHFVARVRRIASPEAMPELERLLAGDFIRRRPLGNGTPFERFLTRPAAEPAMVNRWSQILAPLEDRLASSLVRDLTGEPARPRGAVAASSRDRGGTRTVYADLASARGWVSRIRTAEVVGGAPFALACHAYAEVALSHPFADGNGRLARVVFQRSLARAGALTGPLLPLGPLFYRHHRRLIQALVTLGSTGEWEPLTSTMEALCHHALDFTERVLAEPEEDRGVGGE